MDIDIDLANRNNVLDKVFHVPARLKNKKHNTGVYFHRVPVDPITGTCTIDHKQAESQGYFKIDLLNVHLYKDIRDENHLIELMNKEPMWELLCYREFVEKLFHVGNHYDIVSRLLPTSIDELAAVLAIIRPAKRHLLNEDWKKIHKEVWTKPTTDEYFFKRSHGIAYAIAVTVHMNLLCEQAIKS